MASGLSSKGPVHGRDDQVRRMGRVKELGDTFESKWIALVFGSNKALCRVLRRVPRGECRFFFSLEVLQCRGVLIAEGIRSDDVDGFKGNAACIVREALKSDASASGPNLVDSFSRRMVGASPPDRDKIHLIGDGLLGEERDQGPMRNVLLIGADALVLKTLGPMDLLGHWMPRR